MAGYVRPLMCFSHSRYATNAFHLMRIWRSASVRTTIARLTHDNVINGQVESETISESEIQKLANMVWQKACDKDVMVRSLPKVKVYQDVKSLLQFGISKEDVAKLGDNINSLKNLSNLSALISKLLNFGFDIRSVIDMLHTTPQIQNLDGNQVAIQIETLQKAGCSAKGVVNMVITDPCILQEDLSKVTARIAELKQLFKTKHTINLVEGMPMLLFCDMNYIHDRFNYVYHEMGITQPQMMYSNLFSYPMEHIHARHMFVFRAGFFKKSKRKEGQIDTNSTLDTILDTTDEEFVKKFGDMTVTDYHTFKKLLLRENRILKELENEHDIKSH